MAQALTMLSAFGGLESFAGRLFGTDRPRRKQTMNSANNGLIEANAAVGTMQNQVSDANSAITLQPMS